MLVLFSPRSFGGCLFAALLLAAGSSARAAGDDVVTKLPAAVEDVAVAGSGRLLVLKLRGEKGLTVYDAKTEQMKKIELPTADFSFGAGGDTAVVFLKEANEFQSWSLKTFNMTKAKGFADPVNILQIVMGHSRGDLALLRVARGNEQGAQTTCQILDVVPLSIRRTKNPQEQFGNRMSPWATNLVRYRANGDMSRITEWTNGQSPNGIGVFEQVGDGYQYTYSHNSAGYLASGDDGKIYSGSGAIFDLPSNGPSNGIFDPTANAPHVSGQSLLPGLGGLFFLGLASDGGLTVYQAGQTEPLCPVRTFAEWAAPKPLMPAADPKQVNPAVPPAPDPPRPGPPPMLPWTGDPKQPPGMKEEGVQGALTLDKRVVFAPALGYTIFLPYTNDRLIRREFDLKAALELTKNDYLLVLSSPPPRAEAGSRWEYQIVTLAKNGPVKLELKKAPEGMTISPEGRLTWKIPGGVQGKGRVELTITDGKNNVLQHCIDVTFE